MADVHLTVTDSPRTHRRRRLVPDVIGGAAFLVVALLLRGRLDKGVDFGDEGYYALFLDDWLKGGVHDSAYRAVHETAALLIYPLAWLFVQVNGSTDGMFLALRYFYLLCSLMTALAVVGALRKAGLGLRSWVGGGFVLAFIPFGLPAPSYDTTGLQALCVALAAYTIGALRRPGAGSRAWLALSALSWAVATVAYPPLLVAACVLAVLLVLHRSDERLAVRPYLGMVVALQALGWGVVVAVLSPSRLRESFDYTSAVSGTGGLVTKLHGGVDLLRANPWFAGLCVAALLLGLLRPLLPPVLLQVAVAGVVALEFARPAVLFVRSHDVVTLLVLAGVGLLWDLRPRAEREARVLALLFAASLAAGLTTMVFATNLLFNFSIGGAFAAALVVAGPSRPGQADRVRGGPGWAGQGWAYDLLASAAGAVAVAAVLVPSLTFFYADVLQPGQTRQRVATGFFKGIEAAPQDAELLQVVRRTLVPALHGQSWFVFVGRSPGVVLDTPGRLQMLTSFPLVAPAAPEGLAMTAAFYSDARHRPETVVVYRDRYLDPVNPMGARFGEWYALQSTTPTPIGTLELYRRRAKG